MFDSKGERATPLADKTIGKSVLSKLPTDKRLNFHVTQQSVDSAGQTELTQNNKWGTLHEFLGKLTGHLCNVKCRTVN